MTHAPKYWARKLSEPQDIIDFWLWITEWDMDGETAYYLVLRGELRPCYRA